MFGKSRAVAGERDFPAGQLTTSLDDSFISLLNSDDKSSTATGRTVTIYLCGTESDRDDCKNYKDYFDGENISYLYSIDLGKENIDKIIVDGIGREKYINRFWVPYNQKNGQQTPYAQQSGDVA